MQDPLFHFYLKQNVNLTKFVLVFWGIFYIDVKSGENKNNLK